jgi:hypothetical protein
MWTPFGKKINAWYWRSDMARPREVMALIIAHLDELRGATATSGQIAAALELTQDQVRSALKVLKRNKELHCTKDQATSRGLRYRAKRPPAYRFVDPALFDRATPMGSMAAILVNCAEAANDFSILSAKQIMHEESTVGSRRA